MYFECGFTRASIEFMDIAIRRSTGFYKKLTLNFKKYNEEIGKNRLKGVYSKGHLFNVREQVLNSPIIKILEQHAPYVYDIAILPFDEVQKIEQTAENLNATDVVVEPRTQDRESDFGIEAEDNGIDQQQLIATNKECLAVGIKYKKEDLPIIASFGIDAVKQAVNYFKKARLTSTIRNPAGWLRCCLRRKYYLDDFPTFSPINKLIEQINFVLNEYGTLPSEVFNLISSKPPDQLSLFPKKLGISSVN